MIVTYGPVRSYNSGGRGKKNIRVRKGIPDMYVAFRFCAKLTILIRGNQRGVVWVKI